MSITTALGQPFSHRIIFPTLLVCLALIMPIFLWLSEVGNPIEYFLLNSPPGQKIYSLSKLCGLIAIGIIWLQIFAKLTTSLKFDFGQSRQSLSDHRFLGIATFGFISVHAILFISAVSIRADHLVIKMLAPNLFSGFFTTAVSLGVIAFYILIGCILFAILYLKLKTPKMKSAHRLVYVSFVLGATHSLLIGSETRSFIAIIWYCILLSSVAVLFIMFTLNRYKHSTFSC